ncbi:cytochrome c, class I (plasmid) [Novosphingobium aromaticivorans DSM 12444]|uniref:Cytochrome c, class I n=1 Tax=Novosphingobium aromaticivorans (strain ATCC 700278 / DSM 12444 / CCUG 56034 / CIP 105152 / NBRC 16084 / F199) TaxID=279238 RepID=A4XEH9_NOVAD|nr:c-type cytochrome [Novosphingobium aromaticivorans]ABP64340.1 cytochrome c, class I [Novosphingobium aromaticivorans DSM 12444]SCY81804.1 cytochrome c [Novosphingobium aromaticivorans]
MKKILPPVLGALVALGAAPIALAQTAASPAKGQQVFKTQCGACHSVVAGKNQIGPSLAGVVGRKAGKAAGFKYSPALAKASFTWDKARLDKFVAGPSKAVPGNRMPYPGLADAGARQALLAYLASVK